MSKRRLKDDAAPGDAPERLTPEERKIQRRREKAQASSGKTKSRLGSPARRALYVGIPAAIIVVVVVLLVFNPFKIGSPCLTLQTSPTDPYYPDQSKLSSSWCPPGNPANAYVVEPMLSIEINGTAVGLPAGIGVNKSYQSYTCNLPVTTPVNPGVLPPSVFAIASPWSYSYNLSWFFKDWAATFATVSVDSSHTKQTVEYTNSNLLGYPTGYRDTIGLFVDNVQSSAGPTLVLSTLDYMPMPFPSCIASVYGTGHRILLDYMAKGGTAGEHGVRAATDGTGPAVPELLPQNYDGPQVRLTVDSQLLEGSAAHGAATLAFAVGRGLPGG